MSDLVLQKFAGVDVRRSQWTSAPGALVRLQNGHVNQGGEVEKRKAFVKTALPSNTFGLLATPTGLMTFGSIAAPALPADFLYRQLISPLGHAMTALNGATCSTLFNSIDFACATFGTDGTFCFYGGVLVEDFISGLVLTGLISNDNQASALVALVNATTNYTAALSSGNIDTVIITGENGASFTINTTVTSTNTAAISSQIVNNGTPASQGNAPVASFRVCAGQTVMTNSAGTITLPQGQMNSLVGGGPGVNVTSKILALASISVNDTTLLGLMGGEIVAWTGSTYSTALAIAEAINVNTTGGLATGFYATINGDKVNIYTTAITNLYNQTAIEITTDTSVAPVPGILFEECAISFNFAATFTLGASGTAAFVDATVSGSPVNMCYPGAITFTPVANDKGKAQRDFLIEVCHSINGIGSLYQAVTDGSLLWISRVTLTNKSVPLVCNIDVASGNPGITFSSNATNEFNVILPTLLTGFFEVTGTSAFSVQSTFSGFTQAVTAIIGGGTKPYTYEWNISSSSFLTVTPTNPSSPTTAFNLNGTIDLYATGINTDTASVPNVITAIATLTVTDSSPTPLTSKATVVINFILIGESS